MGKKITFTQDHTVKDEEGKEYINGKTYPVSDGTASHFIRRGMAFDQDAADTAAAKSKAKAKAAKDEAKKAENEAKAEAKAEKAKKAEAKKAEDEAKAKAKAAEK